MIRIRPAEAGDAQALVQLASEISSEESGWLLTTEGWRSVTDERRYLRAVRRHPDAAVFVVDDDGVIVGRLVTRARYASRQQARRRSRA